MNCRLSDLLSGSVLAESVINDDQETDEVKAFLDRMLQTGQR